MCVIYPAKGIRSHRGKEQEYMNLCIQEIRKEVQSRNAQVKSNAILKLSYLSMFGYDMSFASFPITEVMSAPKFAVKRPGYLAASVSFTDKTDVALLTINLFKKDFGSKSPVETGMASKTGMWVDALKSGLVSLLGLPTPPSF